MFRRSNLYLIIMPKKAIAYVLWYIFFDKMEKDIDAYCPP